MLAGVPDEWLDGDATLHRTRTRYGRPTATRCSRAWRRAGAWLPALHETVATGGSTRVPTDRTGQPSRALWRERP